MKLDSRGVRSFVADSDAQVVIRSLGERVETFSLQQMVYVESVVEEDVIGGLKSKVSQLEEFVLRLERWLNNDTRQLRLVGQQLEVAHEELEKSRLFLHQGMSNALRAFCDLVYPK